MTMEDCGGCGVYVDYDDEIMNVMSMMMSRACEDDVRPSGCL